MGFYQSKQLQTERYCLLDRQGALYELKKDQADMNETIDFKYIKKTQISHDTFIYTYEIPNNLTLGLNLGQHLAIDANIISKECPDGEEISRKYTPVSWIFDEGKFELLIKVYHKNVHPNFPEGGKMSQYLNDLQIGDFINVRGPFGKLIYLGNGNFKILKKFKPPTFSEKSYNRVGMLAGGTGITPIYQILQAADKNKDITEFTLIFGNKTSNDILMKKELDDFISNKNFSFKLHYLIDKCEDGWDGLTGYIDKDMVKNYFPSPSETTMMLLCGPPVMCERAKQLFYEIGHKADNVFEF